MSYKIVVMSCDKNQDLWFPFHYCIEKYWKDHPEIIYSTETKENPYYTTICKNLPITKWTTRAKETIKDLPCKHILLLVDDIFIRDYVDSDKIWSLTKVVSGNIASCNLEISFDDKDLPITSELKIRNSKGKFKLSLMCQMWNKQKLLRLLNFETDPWTFEKANKSLYYDYLISRYGDFINWGRTKDDWRFGIVKGKWARECKDFFDKEGIEIDYTKRGFFD